MSTSYPQFASTQNGGNSALLQDLQTRILDIQSKAGVKSIQRGVSVGAGTATITAVNVTKSTIRSISKGSAGYVAATGNISLSLVNNLYYSTNGNGPSATDSGIDGTGTASGTVSGGSTDLTTKQYSAVLTNSTTVTFDGPCEWEVVEYN